MGQYLTPGVYMEEIPGAKPIAGVGTATGAFVGIAEKGAVGKAQLITNWTQFVENFGSFVPYSYLAYAVNQFFAEGGTRCYVVRTCHYNYASSPVAHTATTGGIILNDTSAAPGAPTLKIDAQSPGSWSDHLWIEIGDAKKDKASKFRLVVWYRGNEVEAHEELTKDDVVGKVNAGSRYIKAAHQGTSLLQPARSAFDIPDRAASALPTLRVTARAKSLLLAVADGAAGKFTLVVIQDGLVVEQFINVSIADVERKVSGTSAFLKLVDLKSASDHLTYLNRPKVNVVVLNDRHTTPAPTLRVAALLPGLSMSVTDGVDPDTFALTVTDGTTPLVHGNLTMANAEKKINGISKYITVQNLGNAHAAPDNRPANAASAPLPAPYSLPFFDVANGDDGLANGLTLRDGAATPANSLHVNAFREGVKVKIDDASSGAAKFKLTVFVNEAVVETFDELIMETIEDTINGSSANIEVMAAANANRPANIANTEVEIGLADSDFIGDEATQNGIHAFDVVDDINIMAIPDRPGDREVISGAYTYCQNRRDCFFVADPPFGLDPQGVLAFKEGREEFAGNGFNSSYGALYYPWIATTDPVTGKNRFVPPSGAVAGTYSSTDVLRGVHKAPAGTIDGYLNSAVGIERILTRGEQELLNPAQINAIRTFPASGIVVWGARTLSADPEWRYVNVRRLLLYIEESIYNGTQWVVFEPNDRTLWAKVKRDVSAFLTIVWRSGALFGSTEEEAFYVKIDDENNPQETRDAGQLIIDIGVAPVKPAEFVIFRISQKTQSNG